MTADQASCPPYGRTCVIVTARSHSIITIPTPVPYAISWRISMPEKLIPPCVVVPTHDVIRGVVTRWHHLDHRADAPAHIGQLAILQPQPRRRPQREDRVATHSQAACSRRSIISKVGIVQEWLPAPPLHHALDLLGRQ